MQKLQGLRNTIYKIFSNVLHSRLQPYDERIVGKYQCGFRPGKSTVDQIFTIKQILEKTREFDIDTHQLFVDLKAAYDSISLTGLFRTMLEFGIPEKFVNLSKIATNNLTMLNYSGKGNFRPFTINTGLIQGDALACLLFNTTLERVV